MPDNRLGWIALNLMPGVGPVLSRRLAEVFGSPASVFSAPDSQLAQQRGIDVSLAKRLASFNWKETAEKELAKAQRLGCRLVTLEDKDYPEMLRLLAFPPPVLYLRGVFQPEDRQALAVVGSRNPSQYGLSAAKAIVRDLVNAGFIIVSGLARGIDAIAHRTALEAGGRSVAVLAHGLHRVYPEANKKLHDQLITQGAIVSEFPLGVNPRPAYFPRRNRIISGLARGVLVVEAGPVSGALITARWAGEQGREVFAVPGSYNAWLCRGTHALIQDGAKLVTGIQDILDELPTQHVPPDTNRRPEDFIRPELNSGQSAIFQALETEELHVDQLAAVSKLPVNQVLTELLIMELKGLVHSSPGQVYFRVNM